MQSCKNADLNLMLVAATTNGLTLRIVNSLQYNAILGGGGGGGGQFTCLIVNISMTLKDL